MNENKTKIAGILYKHGENDFSIWFPELTESENKEMALQEISGFPEVKDAADTISFCVPETDTQELRVKLSITEETDGETGKMLEWSILEWKETATDVRQEETRLPLMERQK